MNAQMKVQKILCFLMIVTAAVSFVFSLGLLTDIYQLYFVADWGFGPDPDLYTVMQPFNSLLVKLIIVMIAISTILFITRTNSRHHYYITNYISTSLISAYGIASSIYCIKQIQIYKTKFLTETDFENWKMLSELFPDGIKYTESTFWLDINMFFLSMIIIVSVLLILNLIWKAILTKQEKNLLKRNDIEKEEE